MEIIWAVFGVLAYGFIAFPVWLACAFCGATYSRLLREEKAGARRCQDDWSSN